LVSTPEYRSRSEQLGTEEWNWRSSQSSNEIIERLYEITDRAVNNRLVDLDGLHGTISESLGYSSPWESVATLERALDFMDIRPDQDGRYSLKDASSALAARASHIHPVIIDGEVCYRMTTGELTTVDLDGVLIPTSKGFRSLVELERVESEPVRCISVDSPDHTYLIGDGVVTSNTQQMVQIASQI